MFRACVRWLRAAALALLTWRCLAPGYAEVLVPNDDGQVIEVLPGAGGSRNEDRKLRQQWSREPGNPQLATALAQRYLERSRELGDPRFAGQAMALLRAWPDPQTAPDDVLLTQATLQQYVHEFDAAAANLELLVKRRPGLAQAWLTLATVRRVQGRLDASDQACKGLATAGAELYARACSAENLGLRGRIEPARAQLESLLATPRLYAPTRGWLLTTFAELESRAGHPHVAETLFRRALDASPDAYARLALADELLLQGRSAQVLELLNAQPRTDAVLLRVAIAGTRARTGDAASDVRDMRQRFEQANLRPQARGKHAREQAMFALWVEQQPERALALARENVREQREPTDLLVLAQAARASGDPKAIAEVRALLQEIGIHDKRVDALL